MVKIKRLMSVLLSVMMLFSTAPSNTVYVKADTKATVECDHIMTEEALTALKATDFFEDHKEAEYQVGMPAFVGVEVPANCTEDGWRIEKTDHTGFCLICGEVITEGDKVPLPKTGHDFSKVIKEPTCTESGINACTHVNYELKTEKVGDAYISSLVKTECNETETVPATGHTWGDDIVDAIDATCTEDGYKKVTHTCEVCDTTETVSEEIFKATGHTWGDEVEEKTEPTCTDKGHVTITKTCEVCGTVETVKDEDIAELGHDYQSEVIQKADCTKNEIIKYTCTRCNDSYIETKPALGHTGDDLKVTKEPDCLNYGVKEGTCERCGQYVIIPLEPDKTKHDYVATVEKEPTCTEDGVTRYTCSRCGDTYTEAIDKLGHTNLTVTLEPTCISYGKREGNCERCGKYIVEAIDPLGHDYKVEEKEATCTEDGYVKYICERCGDSYFESYELALGHDYKITESVEATCTTDGYNVYTCDRCGDSYTEITTPALGHDYVVDPTLDKTVEATCTEDGSVTHYEVCSRCGDTKEASVEVIPALGHDYTVTERVEPTCTETGRIVRTCSKCGEANIEVLPAKGHDWVTDETEEANCAHGTISHQHCDRCDEEQIADDGVKDFSVVLKDFVYEEDEQSGDKVATIEKAGNGVYYIKSLTDSVIASGLDKIDILKAVESTGHDYTSEFVPATCENDAHWTLTCVREGCTEENENHTVTIAVPNTAFGHNWHLLDDDSSKAPTCTEDGYRHYMCLNDHAHTYTETIPATGHEYKVTDTVAATCTTEGCDIYTCEKCGDTYKKTTTPALGHSYKITESVAATCAKEGYNVFTCTRCDDTYTETIAKIPHKGVVTGTVSATCTKEGCDIYTCKECGETWNVTTTPAKGHHFVETNYVAPTCTEKGIHTYNCTDCDETYTTTENALGHNYGKVSVVEPTCTEKGYTIHSCTNPGCTDSYKTDETDKIPHVLSVIEQKDATCTENGYIVKGCANCDYTETEILPATGHIFDDEGVNTPATCEKEGYTTYTCAVCNKQQVVKTSEKLGHVYKSEVTAAAKVGKDGIQTEVCIHCGKKIVSNTIKAIKSVTLSQNKFAYTGKKILPAVIVKDADGNTISSKYYKVTYTNNVNIGIAKAKVTFKGLYTGTVTLKYTIVPKGVGISKISSAKNSIKYTWGRVKNADGYKIQYSTSKNFKKVKKLTIRNRKTCSYKFKKLKSGKKYYIRVRAYKKVKGKTYYGNWSIAKVVTK